MNSVIIGGKKLPFYEGIQVTKSLRTFVDSITVTLIDTRDQLLWDLVGIGKEITVSTLGGVDTMRIYGVDTQESNGVGRSIQLTCYHKSVETLLSDVRPKTYNNTTDNDILTELLAGYSLDLGDSKQLKQFSITSEMSLANAAKKVASESGYILYENNGTIFKRKPTGDVETGLIYADTGNNTIQYLDNFTTSENIENNVFTKLEGYAVSSTYSQMTYSNTQSLTSFYSGDSIDIDRLKILNLQSKDQGELEQMINEQFYKVKTNAKLSFDVKGRDQLALNSIVTIKNSRLKINAKMYLYESSFTESKGMGYTTLSFAPVGQLYP